MTRPEHLRTELLPTVLFGTKTIVDSEPISAANGRLLPGFAYSTVEFGLLWRLAVAQEKSESLELFALPTTRQLGRITINHAFGCWELLKYDDPKHQARYPKLHVEGATDSHEAHRTMYAVFYGGARLQDGVNVDHLCDNKSCCYPRHLEAVTPATNTNRGNASKRRAGNDQFGFDFD